MGYRRGTLLFALLGIVLAAGCSADVSHPSALGSAISAPPTSAPHSPSAPVSHAPGPSAPSAASASASESPTTSGTPTSAATGDASPPTSADGIAAPVRATAREYIDDFNIALATGDVTKIEALTSPTCGCRQLVNSIKQMSAQGERYNGVGFTIKSIEVTYLAVGASSDVKYSISAGRVLDGGGKEVRESSPTPDEENDLFIVDTNGRWTVQQSYLLGASSK